MERVFEISQRLVRSVQLKHKRYLYKRICWQDRLIFIKGQRGVGKTTLLLQHIRETFPEGAPCALYVSLDNIWFNDNSIVDLADFHYKHGGTHLFLDEVHRYPSKKWEQEIKNIYDSYPDYNIVFTGSSLLQINHSVGDLSRRMVEYEMEGLSFREYLEFTDVVDIEPLSLTDLLASHQELETKIVSKVKILPLFDKYIKMGYYPFFLDSSEFSYGQRVERLVSTVIDIDVPAVENIEYESLVKMKRLLVILSEKAPFVPNIESLSRELQVTRNQLMRLLGLLSEGKIMRQVFESTKNTKNAAKPAKLLFNNTSVMTGLGLNPDTGTARETFAASMLAQAHDVKMAPAGDFLIDGKYTVEVGGKSKKFAQIADLPDSYIAADGIETAFGNRLPLWTLGMLY